MIHIGKLIQRECQRQNISAIRLAEVLFCDRSNIYDIFKRQSVDVHLLIRLSRLLKHNFFQDIYKELGDEWCVDKSQQNKK